MPGELSEPAASAVVTTSVIVSEPLYWAAAGEVGRDVGTTAVREGSDRWVEACGLGAGVQLIDPIVLAPYCTKPCCVGGECWALIGR